VGAGAEKAADVEAETEAKAEAEVAEQRAAVTNEQSSDGEDSEFEALANLERRNRGFGELQAKVPPRPEQPLPLPARTRGRSLLPQSPYSTWSPWPWIFVAGTLR
jgi:hypothetical protein